MTPSQNVEKLAAAVQHHLGDGPFDTPVAGWEHMGAVICDSVLQAGLHYENVVRPRVEAVQRDWPDAATVAGFRARLAGGTLSTVLRLNNQRKLATIPALAEHLGAAGVDTREQLRDWLTDPAHGEQLRAIKGIGPKTVDYLRALAGHSTVMVDVHLRRFAAAAGITETGYHALRTVYEQTADHLGHDPGAMEHAVWQYMSKKKAQPGAS